MMKNAKPGMFEAACLTLIACTALIGAILCYTIVKPSNSGQAVDSVVQAAYDSLVLNQSTHDDAVKALGAPTFENSTAVMTQSATGPGVQPVSTTKTVSTDQPVITAEWIETPGLSSIKLIFQEGKLVSKQMDSPSTAAAGWLISFLTVAGAAAGGIAGFTFAERKGSQFAGSDSKSE